jgi:hypothetical protein
MGKLSRVEADFDDAMVVRAIDHFLRFADPRFREIDLVRGMLAARDSIVSLSEAENAERSRRDNQQAEEVILGSEGS